MVYLNSNLQYIFLMLFVFGSAKFYSTGAVLEQGFTPLIWASLHHLSINLNIFHSQWWHQIQCIHSIDQSYFWLIEILLFRQKAELAKLTMCNTKDICRRVVEDFVASAKIRLREEKLCSLSDVEVTTAMMLLTYSHRNSGRFAESVAGRTGPVWKTCDYIIWSSDAILHQ